MTTNLEITDEAVNAATGVYGGPTGRMRAALAAALPHLRVQETPTILATGEMPGCALCDGLPGHMDCPTCRGTGRLLAPEPVAVTLTGHGAQFVTGTTFTASASPAPRPVVDRGALVKAFGVVYLENILFDHEIETLADAVLSLLPTEEDTVA